MKDKQRHQLLDAVRELVGHPDMNRGDADLAWLCEVGEGLYNASEHTIHSQLEGGRLAGIQRRLGVLPASKGMTPTEFVELAQMFHARPSVWTEDVDWVVETLRDVAHVRPGRCVPPVVAERMRELATHPTPRSPARRAQDKAPPAPPKPEPSTKVLEAWWGILREDREWLGIEPGSTSFGPIRKPLDGRKWRMRTFRAQYEFPMLRLAQMSDLVEGCKVYIEAAPDCGYRRVTAVYSGDYICGAWGYHETTQGNKFIPLPKEVFVEDTPEPLFRPIGLADLTEGREVFVPDGDSLRKVSAFCLRHAGPARWGYLEELTDGPEGRSVFREFTDDITIYVKVKKSTSSPPGYREIDLAEMSVGDYVFVRIGDCLREVTVEKRRNDAGEIHLGYVHLDTVGWKFSEFTGETYVKVRGTK